MRTNKTRQKIIDILTEFPCAKPGQLARDIHVSRTIIHREINTLMREKRVRRVGLPPDTVYQLMPECTCQETHLFKKRIYRSDLRDIEAEYL